MAAECPDVMFVGVVVNMILRSRDPNRSCAVLAAKERLLCLDAVADDLTAAVRANGRKFVYRTLKTVEYVRLARCYNFERKIIIVSTNFANRHIKLPVSTDDSSARREFL